MSVPSPEEVQRAVLAHLAARAPDATICPSEVARALVGPHSSPRDWREAMPWVHAAVDKLQAEGAVRLLWKGRLLAARSGPYRIAASTISP